MNRCVNTGVVASAVLAALCATAAGAATAERFRVRLQVVEVCTVVQTPTLEVTCALRSPYRIQAVGGMLRTPGGGPVTMLEVFF